MTVFYSLPNRIKLQLSTYLRREDPFIWKLRDHFITTFCIIFAMFGSPNYICVVLIINHYIIFEWCFK